MDISEADLVDAGLHAYDRGWNDCLEATIEIARRYTAAELLLILTQLHDNPPSSELT